MAQSRRSASSTTLSEATAESSIPLLSINNSRQSDTMSSGGSIEKQHSASVAVGSADFTDSSSPNPSNDNAVLAYEDDTVVVNQGRLRRLFSFVQLLAFALTFMSSWEVIAM